MIQNRSAPPGPVVPILAYQDVAKAVDWLCGAFGFKERLRTPPEPDGSIHHAQLAVGDGCVILTSQATPKQDSIRSLLIHVDHADAHCARAQQFGARILMLPGTKEFGERQYAAEDLEGNRWGFTESVADVSPESWGARVGDLTRPFQPPPRPSVCYLQIPAVDVHQSSAFYEKVFGWNIRRRESGHPSFDDASGHVSGGWFTGRPPCREPGLIVSIWVDDIHATLALVAANGGEVFESPHPDQPGSTSFIANFRDPAGNVIGLYQEADS
ncbi:MAG: VOC family protein [Bryobacteraceae bacterium]|jgi:predicted enzyme related to lactoylglutathione lyase